MIATNAQTRAKPLGNKLLGSAQSTSTFGVHQGSVGHPRRRQSGHHISRNTDVVGVQFHPFGEPARGQTPSYGLNELALGEASILPRCSRQFIGYGPLNALRKFV